MEQVVFNWEKEQWSKQCLLERKEEDGHACLMLRKSYRSGSD